MHDAHALTQLIKAKAADYGFSGCGVARARKLTEEEARFKEWLAKGHHGQMQYLERNLDKRLDPTLLVPHAKSVICFMYNYFPAQPLEPSTKISRYAYGRDYHTVIKEKLKQFVEELQHVKTFSFRIFVDSAPVHERAWAQQSGLGWQGKNTLLINKKQGSYFFLAEIICDLELVYDEPEIDHCGTCTACIDACPTNAIQPYVVKGSQCISYWTIEYKGNFTDDTPAWNDWIFGCDICQEVCPWNRFSKPHHEPQFEPTALVQHLSADKQITEEEFLQEKDSPLTRTGLDGLLRNQAHVKK